MFMKLNVQLTSTDVTRSSCIPAMVLLPKVSVVWLTLKSRMTYTEVDLTQSGNRSKTRNELGFIGSSLWMISRTKEMREKTETLLPKS
jgi:hypothetical protein